MSPTGRRHTLRGNYRERGLRDKQPSTKANRRAVPRTRLTARQPGILCMWLVRSPGTVSHCTFVRHLRYQLLKHDQDIFSRVPTSLTNCFAEYEQRTSYGALTVTPAIFLRLINCRFISIIFYFLLPGEKPLLVQKLQELQNFLVVNPTLTGRQYYYYYYYYYWKN